MYEIISRGRRLTFPATGATNVPSLLKAATIVIGITKKISFVSVNFWEL